MFDFILKSRLPLPRIESLGRFLFIGPHPDDIEVFCAPTVKKLVSMGKEVYFLIVTDGAMGTADPSLAGRALAERRFAEAEASAALLGVSGVSCLGFSDAGCYGEDECARAIAREIVRLKPDAVFAPDPDVISECHADHIKTGRAAKYALCLAPYASVMASVGVSGAHEPRAIYLYGTDRPNAFISVRGFASARRSALECHKSQFDTAFIDDVMLYNALRSSGFALRRFSAKAEGYRGLTAARAHCLPEASRW